jgi:hypothetical protein
MIRVICTEQLKTDINADTHHLNILFMDIKLTKGYAEQFAVTYKVSRTHSY